jgi:L-cysteine S-thiosulfotransferase
MKILNTQSVLPTVKVIGLFVLFALTDQATAQTATQGRPTSAAPELVESYVRGTWKAPAEGWQARVDQDETQRACTISRNEPPTAEFNKILEREKATVIFPADGKVLGDWKAGEKVAQAGTGGQFTDNSETPRGGNCYACHQMAKAELSYGTLGPSLHEYGKVRKFAAEDAKAAYAKIFNAQSVLPCSNMPRFGYHKFLSEQQIKDVTAYLFDPQSPVNK